MSLYLDTVQMQYTKDLKPQTYYQLSGDFENTEFILPDNQENLPTTPNAILALALRQSQYAYDIEDLENNNFDYDVFKELINAASDNIIVNGAVVLQKDVQSIQELNNTFQAIDMAIRSDGYVDMSKLSHQDSVFHVLFEKPGFFDLERSQIDEIIELATDELEDGRSDFTVDAIDAAKEQLGLSENTTSQETATIDVDKEELIGCAIEQIKKDVGEGDYTAIAEMLESLPNKYLQGFLSDEASIELNTQTSSSPSNK